MNPQFRLRLGQLLHVRWVGICLASQHFQTRSVFPDRRHPPGLKSPRKCWWAKEITPDLHIGGRPTEKQIKYAADAGFKSIVSLFAYPDDEATTTFGGDYLPRTSEARYIAENVAGLKYANVLEPMDEWASVDAVQKMTQILPTLPKPVYLHCDRGYTITFVTLLYLANQTRHNSDFTPRITSADFYNISAAMGLDFISESLQKVVSKITGEPVPEKPTRPDVEPEDWMDYWMAHPVYKNWFTAGQITKSHISVLEKVGFTSVINMRPGIMLDGKPSQEEVNLLNIQLNTGTYAHDGKEPRQFKGRLEETRIDPKRPNYFISPTSDVNYESRNYDEFGDDIGYRELTERQAFESSKLQYYHLPLNLNRPYRPYVDKALSKFLKIGNKERVLVHCAMGMRAAYVVVLVAAVQYDKDLDWALRRSQELGYGVSEDQTPEIYDTYYQWLVTKRQKKEELWY